MTSAVKAALIGALVFLLSGCFLVEMNMTVSSDDKVSGTMTLAILKETAEALGGPGSADLIDPSDLPEGATTEPYDQDGYVGQTLTFTEVPLEEFNASMQQDGGTFSITRDGDQYQFTGTVDLSGGSEGTDDPEMAGIEEMMTQAMASGSMTLSITFPGEIVDTNGDVDGTTVTWDLADFLEASELHATADADEAASADEEMAAESAADDGSSFPVWPVVLGVAAAVIVIGGAAYLITHRRKV